MVWWRSSSSASGHLSWRHFQCSMTTSGGGWLGGGDGGGGEGGGDGGGGEGGGDGGLSQNMQTNTLR